MVAVDKVILQVVVGVVVEIVGLWRRHLVVVWCVVVLVIVEVVNVGRRVMVPVEEVCVDEVVLVHGVVVVTRVVNV